MPAVLQEHCKAPDVPSALKHYVLTVCRCGCASLLQVRSLSVGHERWTKLHKEWHAHIRDNVAGRGGAVLCSVCTRRRTFGGTHRAALQAIKQRMRAASGTWYVCIEVPLEIGVQSSAKVDVLLVPKGASEWRQTIAIEVNPVQHSTDPFRHGKSQARAAQKMEHYDARKERLCKLKKTRLMELGYPSCAADGTLCKAWLTQLRTAMHRAAIQESEVRTQRLLRSSSSSCFVPTP